MHQQQRRTLQTTRTTLGPAEVLAAAKGFFTRRNNIYAAFPDREGPTFVSMRGQGGEEVLIGVAQRDGATEVTGSSYLYDQQIARFFATLPPAPDAGPIVAGGAAVDATTLETAPPAGAATGTGPAGGTGKATGSAGGSPA